MCLTRNVTEAKIAEFFFASSGAASDTINTAELRSVHRIKRRRSNVQSRRRGNGLTNHSDVSWPPGGHHDIDFPQHP